MRSTLWPFIVSVNRVVEDILTIRILIWTCAPLFSHRHNASSFTLAGSSRRRLLSWQSNQWFFQSFTGSKRMHVRISTISSTQISEVAAQRWTQQRVSIAGFVLSHFTQVRQAHYGVHVTADAIKFSFHNILVNFMFVVTGYVNQLRTRHCAPART